MRERIRIGQVPIDKLDLRNALGAIGELIDAGRGGTVFTPNVDHIVLAERDARFRKAYQGASLSLVDGTPVLWAARLLGRPLPEKVSGSDLVIPLMERAAERGWGVFLLGGAPGAGEAATLRLRERFPGLRIVGVDASRIDLGSHLDERRAVARRIAAASPDLVLVALGAPKQEIFCDEIGEILSPAVLVCVGAGIDFVAGVARRAPPWMSRWGVEWLYRLAQEPRRLAGRYLLRDPQFVGIVVRQALGLGPGARVYAGRS
ncbi:MAG TPA: WecB/TagA/CpsF family glycosyltransferase [Phycisphaerales bacterium]|nr:WecB/TagA/CpsF family glycosyltransferase [Phycisphaerales bacterium]